MQAHTTTHQRGPKWAVHDVNEAAYMVCWFSYHAGFRSTEPTAPKIPAKRRAQLRAYVEAMVNEIAAPGSTT